MSEKKSSLFFSLALPRLSDYARLEGKGGRLPVLVNFCLDEYCNIGYMDGIADALNSIRGFNMSCQVVVQSLFQWQEKYPGKEWENQLANRTCRSDRGALCVPCFTEDGLK